MNEREKRIFRETTKCSEEQKGCRRGRKQRYRSAPYSKTYYKHVRFEVFTAVNMKNGVFWDVTQCGSCKNRRFGGT
jgi:hypothetical protein